jgi:hypothetical protein
MLLSSRKINIENTNRDYFSTFIFYEANYEITLLLLLKQIYIFFIFTIKRELVVSVREKFLGTSIKPAALAIGSDLNRIVSQENGNLSDLVRLQKRKPEPSDRRKPVASSNRKTGYKRETSEGIPRALSIV